jgi:hypothetical protein
MAPSFSWLPVYVLSLFTLVQAADVRALLNERAACVSTATTTRTSVVTQTVKTTTTHEATSKTKTVTTTVLATSTPTITVSIGGWNFSSSSCPLQTIFLQSAY